MDYIGQHKKTVGAWRDMKSRCNNKNAPNYKYYGARGISYPPAWETFQGFLKDLGYAPEGHSLGRIDNNQNYSKENCRWENTHEQARNRRGKYTAPDSGITFEHESGEYVARSSVIILYRGTDFAQAQKERQSWCELNKSWMKT